MSESGGIRWGKVLMGAAVVTAAIGVCLVMGAELGTAIGGASDLAKGIIVSIGDSIGTIGNLIAKTVTEIASRGADHEIATLTTAAIGGGLGMAAATSFVDRFNRSAEMVGIDTGRGK